MDRVFSNIYMQKHRLQNYVLDTENNLYVESKAQAHVIGYRIHRCNRICLVGWGSVFRDVPLKSWRTRFLVDFCAPTFPTSNSSLITAPVPLMNFFCLSSEMKNNFSFYNFYFLWPNMPNNTAQSGISIDRAEQVKVSLSTSLYRA